MALETPPTPTEEEIPELDAKALEQLAHIEAKLGLPGGFYGSLRNTGTDWEFSIKLVVVLEAALAAVIAAKLHNEAITAHVDKLNLDGGRTGKLDLAESLVVLSAIERKAFGTIANIRNRFAHKVENITLDLETFGRSLQQGELEGMQKRLLMIPQEAEKESERLSRGEHVTRFLRLTLFLSGSWLLSALAYQDQEAQVEAERRKFWQPGQKHQWTLRDLWAMGMEPERHAQALEALNGDAKK